MLIDYNKFEIINLGGYKIDHLFNQKLIQTLEEFYFIAQNTHLKYYLSGSICLSILTNTVYRTWKDIDIIIDNNSMVQWLELFPRDKWFFLKFNKNITELYNKKNNNKIGLSTGDPRIKLYNEKYLKITDYNGLKIQDMKTILFWKKNFRSTKKETDIYDEVICEKYLK
jgi:hypothetical protein